MMKKFNLVKNGMLTLVVLGLTFTSCTDDESNTIVPQQQDTSEVVLASEIDRATSSTDDIMIEVFENQEASESKTVNRPPLPDCVTITVVFTQNQRDITIDFGTEGCEVRGNLLKGVINMTYVRNPQAQEMTISYEFLDYYFNDKNILGDGTIVRQFSNANGNPQFTHDFDYTVIWPDGFEVSRQGQLIREWVEGFASGDFSDNVFEITGNWITTFDSGNSHTHVIMTPLRREVICNYFVSGSIDVERTNFGGLFNFGDGDCDNQATFTFDDGTVVDIILN